MKLRGIRKHLTYANVMATLAVFIVLGGGAYAATKLPKNSVGTKQLKKGAVTSAKVKKGAITSAKVKKGAITSAKVKKGSLLASNFKAGQLPKGATGSAGATGPTGTTGAEGGPNAVAEAAGGDDPPTLTSPTTEQTMSSTLITLPETSDVTVWGSMGDQQVKCDASGCQGIVPSDSTDVGIYVNEVSATFPTPVPHAGISVAGGGLNNVQIPPLSGVIKDMPAGTYSVRLILSTSGVGVALNDNGGGLPWVTAIATGSN